MNYRNKYFFFLFLLMFIGLPGNVYPFETYNALVTANINLRSSPGLNSKIITGINGGEKVLVKEQSGDWYQIVIEKENYGFKGWVYGQFLNKIQFETKHIDADRKTKVVEPILQTATQTIQLQDQSKKQPLIQNDSQLNDNITDKKPAVEKAVEIVPEKITVDNSPAEKHFKTINIPEPEDVTRFKQTRYLEKNFSNLQKNSKKMANLPINIKSPPKHYPVTDFVQLLLRLSTVLLSCLALLVSFKALKLARLRT